MDEIIQLYGNGILKVIFAFIGAVVIYLIHILREIGREKREELKRVQKEREQWLADCYKYHFEKL